MAAAKVATAVLLLMQVGWWIIALAGLAASHDKCDDGNSTDTCNVLLGFYWWIVFFQLFLILLMVAMSLSSGTLERFSIGFIALLAIETTLLMQMSNFFNGQIDAAKGSDDAQNRLRAAMAGSVVLSILNLIYIWMLSDRTGALLPVLRGSAAPSAGLPPAPSHGPPSVSLSSHQNVYANHTSVEMPGPTSPVKV